MTTPQPTYNELKQTVFNSKIAECIIVRRNLHEATHRPLSYEESPEEFQVMTSYQSDGTSWTEASKDVSDIALLLTIHNAGAICDTLLEWEGLHMDYNGKHEYTVVGMRLDPSFEGKINLNPQKS